MSVRRGVNTGISSSPAQSSQAIKHKHVPIDHVLLCPYSLARDAPSLCGRRSYSTDQTPFASNFLHAPFATRSPEHHRDPYPSPFLAGHMGNKIVGIVLAICSGFFIGVSFVFKKKGLLDATQASNGIPGKGYAYLKNWTWWLGMSLMILGEIMNFVAYAFTAAILVTPLGALAVVVSAIGSSIFLKERLSFVGKVGCFLCILGAIVIVLNAPEQSSVSTIQEMQHYTLSKVFLPYAAIVLLAAAFVAFWAGPRYGEKHSFVYISICSSVGGISVVCTQGFGASVVSAIGGTKDQWNSWFLWVLFIFVVCTLLVEIIFLNKALNIFNTSIITPIYFTSFTTMTIISSAVLYQGFPGTAVSIVNVVLGFFTIVAGVVLLQISLAAQNKADSQLLQAGLDDVQEVLQTPVDDDTLDPGPASIRGALSLRRFNTRNVSNASQIDTLRRRQTLGSASGRSAGPVRATDLKMTGTTNAAMFPERYHQNTIKFVTEDSDTLEDYNSSISSMETAYTGQKSSSTRLPPLATSRESSLRIYDSEMGRNLPQIDENSDFRVPLTTSRPMRNLNSLSTVTKSFSFASRGGRSEEESIGLVGREKAEYRAGLEEDESESELSDGDDRRHGAI